MTPVSTALAGAASSTPTEPSLSTLEPAWTRGSSDDAVAYSALLLRVALGLIFVAHAAMKLFTFTLPGTAEFFAAHGFPGWSAYPVFAAEALGGLALLVGVGVRWVSLGLVPVMLGALTVHWPNGWAFTAPGGGWEFVAFLIAALVVQAGLGNGAFALAGRIRVGGRSARAVGPRG